MSRSRGRVFASHTIITKALITIVLSLVVVVSICTVRFPRALAALIVSDNFNDNSIDTGKWDTNLFSGFTNTNVPLAETSAQLEIGPLLQTFDGSAYRGIRTVNSYNFSGAYSFVELVKAPESNTTGFAMFTIGNNVDNYYRLYVSAGNLVGEKKIGGSKSTLFTITYDSTNHRFLRIRHDSGNVYLDTAPGSGGAPGTWTQRYTETWNTSISLSSIIFEVKGGTSVIQQSAPGKVIFDNFEVANNSAPAPTVTAISPTSGTTSGGTFVTITGTGYSAGATVTLGGTQATNVTVVSSTSITASTPAHAAGTVNVVVTNSDSQSGTLNSGFTYSAPAPAPTVSAISPTSGTTSGGTSVTITGTGFSSGATVSLGGTAATNVTVVSSTSITATTPAHAAGTVNVVVTNTDSQSGTLNSGYTYTSQPDTVLVSDNFNDNSLDTAKWDTSLFSGFTNTNVPLAETSAQLEIGPLLQTFDGSAYRGIRTVNSYNFSGAYSFVELVKAPESNTTGFAMFTIGTNVDNYYRLYVSAGNLVGEKKIGGSKSTLFTIAYDSTNHRFLRIRHDSTTGAVTLDTATGSSGAPGTWTQRYTETWNTSISLSSIIFEVKGGTSVIQQSAPGKVIFDNFVVAVPGAPTSSSSLKMVSANLQHGMSTDGTFHYDQQANKITSTSDLVAAQEVSEGDISSWDAAFTAGGFHQVKFREHHLSTGDGNAIWARNTLTESQTYFIDLANGTNPTTGSNVTGLDGSDIRRSAVAAKFTYNSKQFYVVSVHLCPKACRDNSNTFESVQRVTQIQDLLSWIDSTLTGGLPVIIMGDLNLTIDTAKQPSGFQFDLFTQAGFSDLWQTGLSNSLAEANWGDRDQNSIPDMPLGLDTRTADTRRIDYILYKANNGSISLVKISVPDGRAQCPEDLVDHEPYKFCPAVSADNPKQRFDVPEDQGVRLSDHNWIWVELGF